jgi:hypothetical protein
MHKTFVSALTLMLTFISGMLLGQKTPEDKVSEDWPNTVNAFGKNSKNVPSHYIFVVDVTEKIFGPEISSQIQSFVDALPANDQITVIQLGPTNETIEIVPTCNVTSKLKKDILDKLNRIEWGRNGSDGMEMADRVISAMTAPGVFNSIPFVFIFSDFEFYLPGRGYFVPPLKEWEKLNSKFKNVAKGLKRADRLNINGLRLHNPNQKNDYFDKLQVVFGKISLSTVSGANLLKAQFINIQADIYRKRLLEFIMDLVSKQNSNIQLENNNSQIILKGSDTLVYHKVILDDDSKNKVSQILNSDKLFSFLPPSETEIEVSGTLVAEKYYKELPELTDIQLKDQKVVLLTADSIIPWWLTDIIALILLLSIWRFIWTIIPPARLKGTIDFFLQGKSMVVLDCGGRYKKFSNNEVTLLKSGFSLEIRATKKFFKGKCLILIPVNGDLLLSSRKQKKTARGGKKTIASVKSRWNIDGIEITMPTVK